MDQGTVLALILGQVHSLELPCALRPLGDETGGH
jgi:hypothetical protein